MPDRYGPHPPPPPSPVPSGPGIPAATPVRRCLVTLWSVAPRRFLARACLPARSASSTARSSWRGSSVVRRRPGAMAGSEMMPTG